MRRAFFVFLGTAVGTGLLVGAKLGTAQPEAAVDLGQTEPVTSALPSGEQVAPVTSTPGTTAPGTAAPTTAATTAPTAAGPVATTKAPAAPPPPSGLKDGTFAGPAVTQRYGTIKVTLVVSGGKITDVTATYPTGGETGRINARSIPRLRQSALTAQSANVATVSGATYTSNAYKQSLQGAINAAKA